MLTVSNVQRIAALEDELVSLGRWPEVCLRQRGQLGCAPLLSAVPYLRHATNELELRAAIDDLYETLEGGSDPNLDPDPDPAPTLALALTLAVALTLNLNLSLGSRGSPLDGLKASWFFEQDKVTSRYESCAPLACACPPFATLKNLPPSHTRLNSRVSNPADAADLADQLSFSVALLTDIMRTHMRLGAPLDASWHNPNLTSFPTWSDPDAPDTTWTDPDAPDTLQTLQQTRMLDVYLRGAEAHLLKTAAQWDDTPVSLLYAQLYLYNEEWLGILMSDLLLAVGVRRMEFEPSLYYVVQPGLRCAARHRALGVCTSCSARTPPRLFWRSSAWCRLCLHFLSRCMSTRWSCKSSSSGSSRRWRFL